MFALLADERNWLNWSGPDRPLGAPVVGSLGWQSFGMLAPVAECGLIVLPRGAGVGVDRALLALRQAHPYLALVVAVDGDAPGRSPAGLHDHCVTVAFPCHTAMLRPAIQRACTAALLAEVAGSLASRTPETPSVLRRGLARCVRRDPPITSVAALAAEMGCRRRTLRRQWSVERPHPGSPSLCDALRWILLLRGVCAHAAGLPWSRVASRLGVHRRTLAHACRGVTGVPLRSLSPEAAPALRAAARAALLGSR